MPIRFAIFLATGVLLLVSATGLLADEPKLPMRLTVAAAGRERTDALVAFSLPQSLAGPALRLIETTGGKEMPVAMQVDLQAARLWWVASGTTATGAKRT